MDNLQQNIYVLDVNILFFDDVSKKEEILPLGASGVVKYEVKKDSTAYNYNIHSLELTGISQTIKVMLEAKNTRLQLILTENSEVISDKVFFIEAVIVMDEIENIYNIQMILNSEISRSFLNESKYSKVSTFDQTAVDVNVTGFQLMSTILGKISSDFGNELDTHYSNSGRINRIFQSLRLPDNLTDYEMFDYIFKEFDPYLLQPYFIMDDMHIVSGAAPYNIIINNICNVGDYNLQSIKSVRGIANNPVNYIGSTPLLNYQETEDMLSSTLVIKNNNENRIHQLKPISKSTNNNQVLQITSNLGIENLKSRMYLLKRLVSSQSTFETYEYHFANIGDIVFLKTYNISSALYDHLPVAIEYLFESNTNINAQRRSLSLKTTVKYAKVPPNLLAGK